MSEEKKTAGPPARNKEDREATNGMYSVVVVWLCLCLYFRLLTLLLSFLFTVTEWDELVKDEATVGKALLEHDPRFRQFPDLTVCADFSGRSLFLLKHR